MNCRDVDRILNEHAASGLSAAERAGFDAHLGACRRCALAVETGEILLGESFAGPRPGLFEAIARRAASESARRAAPAAAFSGARRWQTIGGLAAMAVLVLVVVLGLPGMPGAPGASGPYDVPGADRGVGTGSAAAAAIESAAGPASALAGETFVAGRDYLRVASQPAPADAATLSVIEFFMYLCNPCYRFEPRLQAWSARQDSGAVTVTRVPIQWNPAAALQARAFYTAEVLGVTDTVHEAFFAEIHERGNALDSEAAVRTFFARHGVEPAAFDDAFRSFAVETRLRQARSLADRYRISATPSMLVADAYLATPETAGSYERLIDVVDWLVAESADRCAVVSADETRQAEVEPCR